MFPIFEFVIYFREYSKHGCFIIYLLILIYDAYEYLFLLLFLFMFPFLLVRQLIFDYVLVSVLKKLFVETFKMK